MTTRAKPRWDFLSVVGLLLCLAPLVAWSVRVGLPNDLAIWEWFLILPVAATFVGAPQLAMLIFITMTEVTWLRLFFLATSFALLGIFCWFLATADLTSSSTAGVGVVFLALYLAAGGFVFGLLVLWIYSQSQR